MKIKKINKKTVPELAKEIKKLSKEHSRSKHFHALTARLREKPDAF